MYKGKKAKAIGSCFFCAFSFAIAGQNAGPFLNSLSLVRHEVRHEDCHEFFHEVCPELDRQDKNRLDNKHQRHHECGTKYR